MVITTAQTTRGYARIIFNENWLIVSFYRYDDSLIDSFQFRVLQPGHVYNGGWNLNLLRLIVAEYEPKVKEE